MYIYSLSGAGIATLILTLFGTAASSFGKSVSIFGSYLAVGAYKLNANVGGAYIYSLSGATATLLTSGTISGTYKSYYGNSVSISSAGFMAIGAFGTSKK